MKISRGALIFGGILIAIGLVVAGLVWFSSLFKTPSGGASEPSSSNFFSSLFPFGNTSRPQGGGTLNTSNNQTPAGPAPDVREVTGNAVSGFTFGPYGIRYEERETGHFFETPVDTLAVTRITNTTLPGIYRTVWLSASTTVLSFPDSNGLLKNFLATISSSTADQALTGLFFNNGAEIMPAGDGKKILIVRRDSAGTSVTLADTASVTQTPLFSSPLRSWRILPTASTLYVETAPASGIGHLFSVGKGGVLTEVFGGMSGLMTLPRYDGKYILYSFINSGIVSTNVYDIKNNAVYRIPVNTYAEKCVWLSDNDPVIACAVPLSFSGMSIEDWYIGTRTTADSLWLINPIAGTATIVKDVSKIAGVPIDAMSLAVNADGTRLGFINKIDLSLWEVKLR